MAREPAWRRSARTRAASNLWDPARRFRRLPNPTRQELLVELLVLANVEVSHVLVLGCAGRKRTQRRTAEEGQLDVLREAVEAEKPALPLHAVKGRVPLHRFAH